MMPSSTLSETVGATQVVDPDAIICSAKVSIVPQRKKQSANHSPPPLLKAVVSMQGWNVIFHKDWSGTMIASAFVKEHEADEADEADEAEAEAQPEANNGNAADEAVSVETPRKKAKEKKAKKAKEKTPKRPKRSKRQELAIVYGESPLRLVTDTPFVFFLERTDMSSLVDYYNDRFDGGKSARTFQTAYRAKKGFFVKEGAGKGKRTDFFKEDGEDLRKNARRLFEKRYLEVVKGTEGEDTVPRIYRMVRFSYLERDSHPKNIETISKRFRRTLFGMKEKAYKNWLHAIKKQPIRFFPRESLRCVRKHHFLSNDRTDYRRFCDHMNFYGICPEYWKVARDFPSSIMYYVLKRCNGVNGLACTMCKDMLKFHNENLRNRSIEKMLFPDSPFLKRRGLEIYTKSVCECVNKWRHFRLFPKHTPKVSDASFQRLTLMVELQGIRKKSASTVIELDPSKYSALSVPTMWEILEKIMEFRKDNLLLNDALLEEMKFFLSDQSFVRPNGMTHMLSSVFLLELEFCLLLRRLPVYKNSFPLDYHSAVFPNQSLKAIYESAVERGKKKKGLTEPIAGSKVVVIAFSRRYRLKDLVRKIKKLEASGKECVLHLDDQTPFFYSSFDDLQDWYSELSSLKDVFDFQTGLPFALHGKEVEKKELMVSTLQEFKDMMDAAVLGECYVLVSIDDKRKKFLAFSSEHIRSDPCRTVLERSFPKGDVSSYSMGARPVQTLQNDELTICTPAFVNIFGPRKKVYCMGDMWTLKNKQAAQHLATETVYTVNLSQELTSTGDMQYSMQYNDKKVDYGAVNQLTSPATKYACSSFYFIMTAIQRIEPTVTTQEKAAEMASKTARLEKVRKKTRELHGQPSKKKNRYDS